jgi:hypothetical protein
VEAEKAGADDEGEADQQQPRVPAPARPLADREREREADERGAEDDPEVRRVVLPPLVDVRRAAQEADQRQRQQQRQRPVGVPEGDRLRGRGGCG